MQEEEFEEEGEENEADADADAEPTKATVDDDDANETEEKRRPTYAQNDDDAARGETEASKSDVTGKQKGSKSSVSDIQQHLFLVEFLIDTVTIDSCSVDEEVLDGQTCLTIGFLNFPPMEICEKDFDNDNQRCGDKVRFNSGKSLMFAFDGNKMNRPPPLIVEITVSKKMEEDEKEVKVDIGVIKICISELFNQIVDIVKFKPQRLPMSKSIKDCFMLIGPGKRTMGEVSVYIRLSCLGQNVVTEFHCPNLKTHPVFFKNKEGKKVFEFSESGTLDEADELLRTRCANVRPDSKKNQQGGQGDVARPCLSNGTAYNKGNRILDIPEKPIKPKELTKKTNKCGDGNMMQNERIVERKKNCVVFSEAESNPDENCFVLRVGDKGQIPDRGKMILEFRTPKQKILPKIIPPYHEEVAIQTDSTKKKKGKGKGKKK